MHSTGRDDGPGLTQDVSATTEVVLKTAIDCHMRWKDSLENYVQGVGCNLLSLEMVANDDQCLLGKWIYSEGEGTLGHLPVFRSLVQAHAEFHCQAATILALMRRGEVADATQLMQMGDYPKASARVKGLLAKLYVEVLCQQPRPSRLSGNS